MTVVALTLTLIVGFPLALLVDREGDLAPIFGEAFLLGCGLISIILTALSLAGVPWSRGAVFGLLALTLATSWIPLIRSRASFDRALSGRKPISSDRILAFVFILLIVATAAGHAVFATRAAIPEWDFWAIWGLKGRDFAAHRGIDWAYLTDPLHDFVHSDYPILLPLNYAFHSLLRGGWEDRQLGLLTTAFGLSTLLIVWGFLKEEIRLRSLVAAGTLAVAALALSPWIGMAEAPLIAFGAAGLLLIRRAVISEQPSRITAGAIFLGLSAMTKNEGATLLIAATIALAATSGRERWRNAVRLWPGYALALPWWLLSRAHHLSSDLTAGLNAHRLLTGVTRAGEVVRELALQTPNRPLFWAAIVMAFVVGGFSGLRKERFVLVACALQICAYITAYLITPHDLDWQVATSWIRLVNQIGVPLAFSALMTLANIIDPVQAEALA